MKAAIILLVAIVAVALFIVWFARYRRNAATRREAFIRSYVFPKGLLERLNDKWPRLNEEQRLLVAKGLRQFFLAHAQNGGFVSMPSLVVDELWHQFILHTKSYADFCEKAFGHFMHHTPAVVLGSKHQNNEGLRRTWKYTCKQEGINPFKPSTLPLLFALDGMLAIPGGFVYHPQCEQLRQTAEGTAIHCAGDFTHASSDGCTGGTSDTSDSGGDSSCGGGCGGGD